uniref:hypothetical protein n=1 Tax=Rhodococcus sp. BS-15 TaxID=1304954 RepID=UPI0011AE8F0A
MTIITDRPTAAGVRARSTVVERRRRARPVLHGLATQPGPCLPVLDPSWTDVTDRRGGRSRVRRDLGALASQ